MVSLMILILKILTGRKAANKMDLIHMMMPLSSKVVTEDSLMKSGTRGKKCTSIIWKN